MDPELRALLDDPEFWESLAQMQRGEGRVIEPEEFLQDVSDMSERERRDLADQARDDVVPGSGVAIEGRRLGSGPDEPHGAGWCAPSP